MSESAVGANSAAEGEVVAAENQSSDVANGTANNAQATREPTRLENFLGIAKSLIIRGVIIYFISSFLAPKAPAPTSPTGAPIATTKATNLFHDGTVMALHVYLSENETLSDYDPQNLFWYKDGLVFGDWTSGPFKDGSYVMEKSVQITESMKNNGSLFLHAFITRQGESPNPEASNYGKKFIGATWKQLNRFKQLKASTTKNLLTGETEKDDVEDGKIVSHWHTNFTLNLITDQTVWTSGAVPMPMDQFIQFTDDGKNYKPVLYPNDFWNMARDYKPLNESLKLRVTLQPLSLLKWQIYAAQGMRQMWNVWGENDQSQTDQEQDTLKETLLDTNPYLLGITIAVSILHSVFELLAFKNDIQFWNKRDSLEGLSVRSVFFGVFQSLVVLLYVLDNETNTLVRVSCFIGLGIELWKIYKVVDIKFENGWIQFKDKGSYVQSSTRVYDELAFKYLSWLCFPLLAGYCVYALLYLEHKGWYSFVLDLLYGFLLTFGFIMMTPQLFINYKLHSVAHLPWRMLTYKFLNTFIDDMFAFVIKMPTMYRLGCFRDDIVFLIFLYQRWIYPVDKSRRNEFGYKPEDENKSIEDSKANNQQVEAAAPSKESKKDK